MWLILSFESFDGVSAEDDFFLVLGQLADPDAGEQTGPIAKFGNADFYGITLVALRDAAEFLRGDQAGIERGEMAPAFERRATGRYIRRYMTNLARIAFFSDSVQ